MGEEETFRYRKRLQVSCIKCGVTVEKLYLKQHMEILHVICVPQTRGVDEKGEGPTTYVVCFHRILHPVRCSVPGCLVVAHSAGRLWEIFMF